MMGNVGDRANGLWADAGAMTRILLIMYPLSWFLTSILGNAVIALFYFTPITFFSNLWIWTIVTSSFVQFSSGNAMMDLIVLVFCVMILAQMLPQREKVMGSTMMFAWLATIGVAIRLTFLIIVFVLGKVMVILGATELHWFGPYAAATCSGLWPMYIVFISLRSYSDPTGSTSFWGLVDIPNGYYPAAIYAFFTLMSGAFIRPELLAGLAVGYLYGYGIVPLDRALPSKSFVGRLEDSMWRIVCQRCCLGPDGSGCMSLGARYIFVSEALDVGDGRSYASLDIMDSMGSYGARNFQMNEASDSGRGGGGNSFAAFTGEGQRP